MIEHGHVCFLLADLDHCVRTASLEDPFPHRAANGSASS